MVTLTSPRVPFRVVLTWRDSNNSPVCCDNVYQSLCLRCLFPFSLADPRILHRWSPRCRLHCGQRRCLNVCAPRGVVDDVHWLDQTDGARKAYPVYVFLFDVCSWLVVPDNCDFWLTWSEIEWNVVCLSILGYFASLIGRTRRPVETQVN